MDKLTPIFIAGSLVAAAGLAYAQSQIGEPMGPDAAPGHAAHGSAQPGAPVGME
jgi:hypothetical protein